MESTPMHSRHIIRVALLAAALAVSACQDMDPYTRADTWQPSGSNAGNIAAQVANPYDLIRGRDFGRVDGASSSLAIGRVWTDTPKKLLNPGGFNAGGGGLGGTGAGNPSGPGGS